MLLQLLADMADESVNILERYIGVQPDVNDAVQ
jgi:hypothetical protein